ncbi:MAG: DMT family transporter, partial [Moraxellaceae bacterium]
WQQRKAIAPYLPKLAVLGLLGMLMYQGLAYEAAHTTSATNIGILNAMIPLFTLAIAALLLHEKPSLLALLGGLISLTGIAILIAKGHPLNLLVGDFHRGDILMMLAVVCYAAYGVLTRLWQIPLDLLTTIYLQIGFGILFHLPLVMSQGLSAINANNVWLVLYAGTLPSLVAPLVWIKSIQLIGPSRTSIFINLTPLITAAIAIVYLNEAWHGYHSVGGLLTLTGVILTQLKFAARR